jgi:hypothetical protein
MSVTVIAHFPVADVAKAIEGLQANAALLEDITEDTQGRWNSSSPIRRWRRRARRDR